MDPGSHSLREAVAYMRGRHGLTELESLRLIADAQGTGEIELVASLELPGRGQGVPRSFAPDDWAGVRDALGNTGALRARWDFDANWIGVEPDERAPDSAEGWFHVRFYGFERWAREKLPELVSQRRMTYEQLVEFARSAPEPGWKRFYDNNRKRLGFDDFTREHFRTAHQKAKGALPSHRPRGSRRHQ